MLLVKHRFHYAAQTGFELSLRYQPLKGLELEVHTSVPKCYNQKIQRKKKKIKKISMRNHFLSYYLRFPSELRKKSGHMKDYHHL